MEMQVVPNTSPRPLQQVNNMIAQASPRLSGKGKRLVAQSQMDVSKQTVKGKGKFSTGKGAAQGAQTTQAAQVAQAQSPQKFVLTKGNGVSKTSVAKGKGPETHAKGTGQSPRKTLELSPAKGMGKGFVSSADGKNNSQLTPRRGKGPGLEQTEASSSSSIPSLGGGEPMQVVLSHPNNSQLTPGRGKDPGLEQTEVSSSSSSPSLGGGEPMQVVPSHPISNAAESKIQLKNEMVKSASQLESLAEEEPHANLAKQGSDSEGMPTEYFESVMQESPTRVNVTEMVKKIENQGSPTSELVVDEKSEAKFGEQNAGGSADSPSADIEGQAENVSTRESVAEKDLETKISDQGVNAFPIGGGSERIPSTGIADINGQSAVAGQVQSRPVGQKGSISPRSFQAPIYKGFYKGKDKSALFTSKGLASAQGKGAFPGIQRQQSSPLRRFTSVTPRPQTTHAVGGVVRRNSLPSMPGRPSSIPELGPGVAPPGSARNSKGFGSPRAYGKVPLGKGAWAFGKGVAGKGKLTVSYGKGSPRLKTTPRPGEPGVLDECGLM